MDINPASFPPDKVSICADLEGGRLASLDVRFNTDDPAVIAEVTSALLTLLPALDRQDPPPPSPHYGAPSSLRSKPSEYLRLSSEPGQ